MISTILEINQKIAKDFDYSRNDIEKHFYFEYNRN